MFKKNISCCTYCLFLEDFKMSTSRNYDNLPIKVLSLSGYEFFQFIKSTLGEPEADLLNKISIRTTMSFLALNDPLDIFNHEIEDEDLEQLRDKLCFKLKNDKFMIKPGVISGFRSLKDTLEKRMNEQQTKTRIKRELHDMNLNPNASVLCSLESLDESTALYRNTLVSSHKEHVTRLIKIWCLENKENFDLDHLNLEENVDFTVKIDVDKENELKANIECKCGKFIRLAKNGSKIQVSNYYKHLQSKGCHHFKNIRKAARNSKFTQQHSSTSVESTCSAPGISISVSPVHHQSMEVDNIAPHFLSTSVVSTQTSPHHRAVNSKRRRTSLSQPDRSVKKSRT